MYVQARTSFFPPFVRGFPCESPRLTVDMPVGTSRFALDPCSFEPLSSALFTCTFVPANSCARRLMSRSPRLRGAEAPRLPDLLLASVETCTGQSVVFPGFHQASFRLLNALVSIRNSFRFSVSLGSAPPTKAGTSSCRFRDLLPESFPRSATRRHDHTSWCAFCNGPLQKDNFCTGIPPVVL